LKQRTSKPADFRRDNNVAGFELLENPSDFPFLPINGTADRFLYPLNRTDTLVILKAENIVLEFLCVLAVSADPQKSNYSGHD